MMSRLFSCVIPKFTENLLQLEYFQGPVMYVKDPVFENNLIWKEKIHCIALIMRFFWFVFTVCVEGKLYLLDLTC